MSFKSKAVGLENGVANTFTLCMMVYTIHCGDILRSTTGVMLQICCMSYRVPVSTVLLLKVVIDCLKHAYRSSTQKECFSIASCQLTLKTERKKIAFSSMWGTLKQSLHSRCTQSVHCICCACDYCIRLRHCVAGHYNETSFNWIQCYPLAIRRGTTSHSMRLWVWWTIRMSQMMLRLLKLQKIDRLEVRV